MNKCLNCGKDVKNKYCNVSCQNKHQGSERANKKYGELKGFTIKCEKCGNDFQVEEREKLFPKKEHYFCSRSCANSRVKNDETKEKTRISLLNYNNVKKKTDGWKLIEIKTLKCKNCGCYFVKKYSDDFCSPICSLSWCNEKMNIGHFGGLASMKAQNRRSKNEIYFAELCEDEFNIVLTNEQMFNGWDADIIIEDLKIAVLWNGKWHYEKITKKHSVKQVQNRDRIKIKEIKEKGYIPYIIKDMGKYNKEFVEKEFNKFIKYIVG